MKAAPKWKQELLIIVVVVLFFTLLCLGLWWVMGFPDLDLNKSEF